MNSVTTTTMDQNLISMCKNALADIFSTIQHIVNQSEAENLQEIIRVPYYEKNEQGVNYKQDYTARNAMVFIIHEGLKGKSEYKLTLDEYDALRFLTDAYRKFLHPAECTEAEARHLQRVLTDMRALTMPTVISDNEGDMYMLDAGGW